MSKEKLLWVGTNGPDGICILQKEQEQWRKLLLGGPASASYLIKGPGDLILAAVETDLFEGTPGGAVVSLRLQDGKIQICGQAKGLAKGICHLGYAPRHGLVFAASYPEGSIDVLELKKDGRLAAKTRLIRKGSGPHPEQTGPHAHCCVVDQQEEILYVCDLGSDEIARYELESLQPLESIRMSPGSGPRHLVLSEDEEFLYIACELGNQVSVVGAKNGEILQSICCRPKPEGFCALSSIRFSPDRKNLIVGCRGMEGIWILPVPAPGKLGEPVFYTSSSSFPWDVLPLGDGVLAAAFTHSDCVETGRCRNGRWEPEDTCEVHGPTCLLAEEAEGKTLAPSETAC